MAERLRRRGDLVAAVSAATVVAVALASLLVRLGGLGSQPGGLYPDEAAEGADARRLIDDPSFHPVFFDDDGGREAPYAYLVSVSFRLFGASVTSLRGTSAVIGAVGVVLIWVALRRFGRWAALAGMAWAAGSLWLIAVSRDGFRPILVVPVAALALLTLVRWCERPSRSTALVAGGVSALGLWTYQPLKLLPLLALVLALWLRRTDPERSAALRRTGLWWIAAYLVVASPMLFTAITDARNYFGRGAAVTVFNPSVGAAEPFPVQVVRTLGMFFATGDPNQRHDVDALPLLGPLLALPFLAGIWRAWTLRAATPGHRALLAGLVVFLIPPLIAPEGSAPHFLRSIGLAPFVAGLVGIGCVQLVEWAAALRSRLWPGLLAAGCAAALAALGVASVRTYLARPVAARYAPYSFNTVSLAEAADRGAGTVVIVDDFDALDVAFLDHDHPPTQLRPGVRLRHAAVYSLLVAGSRDQILQATDLATAQRASVAAVDAGGRPAVWEVAP